MNTEKDSIQDAISGTELPVLAEFSAEWCGYCRRIEPALERIEHEFEGRVRVVRVDIDRDPHTAAKYEVESIPAFMLFMNGEATGSLIGPESGAQIRTFLRAGGIV